MPSAEVGVPLLFCAHTLPDPALVSMSSLVQHHCGLGTPCLYLCLLFLSLHIQPNILLPSSLEATVCYHISYHGVRN